MDNGVQARRLCLAGAEAPVEDLKMINVNGIPVVENRETPAGFTSFTRGSFASLAAAQKAAAKHVRTGAVGVVIVHDHASLMNLDGWVVGRVVS